MKKQYNDIITLPHHSSDVRAHMSLHDRAAQFAPFAALTGYDSAIGETARLTDAKLTLSEEQENILSERIHIIMEHIQEKPEVNVTYFIPDKRKPGGAYVTAAVSVRRVNEFTRQLILTDGTAIPLDSIFAITGELFDENETKD